MIFFWCEIRVEIEETSYMYLFDSAYTNFNSTNFNSNMHVVTLTYSSA